MHSRELIFWKNKLEIMENTRKDMMEQCNHLERSIVLLNQAFEKSNSQKYTDVSESDDRFNITLEDVHSEDEQLSRSTIFFINVF